MIKDTRKPGTWWMSARAYELYVDKFAGNFKEIIERLGYFDFLGINALHILPHYPSPMIDDGYDISDYEGVRSELGTLDDFSRFTEEAHKRGIRVISDLVINHTSSEHSWFIEARSSKMSSMRDHYVWSDMGQGLREATNAFPDFKSSNWIWNESTKDYYYATFYPEQPDLNWDNPAVMESILDVVDFWVKQGVDGFRLDAITHLVEREGTLSVGLPETHKVIKNLRAQIDGRYGGRIAFLAEVSSNIPEAQRYFGEGDECQLVYNFPLMRQMLISLMRKSREPLEAVLKELHNQMPSNCTWATFLRNHDEVSLWTLPESEREELLDFLDPGRRFPFNKGEGASVRLGSIFEREPERILEAFELLYSVPGVPVMYYGDEIGMKNLPIEKGIRDSRHYVRGKFDWGIAEQMLADKNSLLHKTARIIQSNALR